MTATSPGLDLFRFLLTVVPRAREASERYFSMQETYTVNASNRHLWLKFHTGLGRDLQVWASADWPEPGIRRPLRVVG